MPETDWEEALGRCLGRVDQTAAEGGEAWPHHADQDTGAWTRTPNGDWTGGFWAGELWLAAAVTGQPAYAKEARRWAELLRPRASSETVFRGFLFWYGAALGWLLTKDEEARRIAEQGAHGLAAQFDEKANLIPLGATAEEATDTGPGEANIDGVPGGTPLLALAGHQDLAIKHASSHIDLCVRQDGSVCQSASFDPATGETTRRYTHKGIRDDSTWTRAQAWAMLGFAQAARLDPDRFRDPALKVADWWLDHLPEDGVARWDFDDPDPDAATDTSGTAIAAASLLKLAPLDPSRADAYLGCAERMTAALVRKHLTRDGRLTGGCYNHRIGLATRAELIWGDYFLLEALAALSGRVLTTRL